MIPSTLSSAVLGLLPLTSAAITRQAPPASIPHWANLTSLPLRQQEHSTVAIDDTTIAVVAGVGFLGNGTVQTGVPTVNTVQLYDIATDTWRRGAPTPFRINHPNVAAVDGRIYLLGGLVDRQDPPVPYADWQASGESHVYDPASDSWSELPSIPPGMERGSAVVGVHGEMIYLAGGMTVLDIEYQDAITTVIAFNTTSEEWQRLPEHAASLPDGRQHAVGAVYDDTFFVVGGRWFEKTNVRSDVFKLDLTNLDAGWTTSESPMPTARSGLCGAVANGRLFVFGGESNPDAVTGVFDNVEVLDLETEQWTELEAMQVPRHGTSAAAVGNVIYIPGGGLQEDGLPVIGEDGIERIVNTASHFDSLIV